MSNALAIATVTTALAQIVRTAAQSMVAGSDVVTGPSGSQRQPGKPHSPVSLSGVAQRSHAQQRSAHAFSRRQTGHASHGGDEPALSAGLLRQWQRSGNPTHARGCCPGSARQTAAHAHGDPGCDQQPDLSDRFEPGRRSGAGEIQPPGSLSGRDGQALVGFSFRRPTPSPWPTRPRWS